MVFSSSLFLLYFFPAFLIVYFLIRGTKWKNLWILLTSILFYAWGAPDFIFIVVGSIIADFYLVQVMDKTGIKRNKRILMALSVLLNIGLLAYFKYSNFFIENINALLEAMGMTALHWTQVALPIGISFFSFQKLTYSVDVYRKVHSPLKRVTDYAMYILMFPQLIAGPIVRFNEIADQIEDRRINETATNRLTGFFRFILGLAKKVLIANVLGEQVDIIFAMDSSGLTMGLSWIGIIAYAFQIYFDFSGYSDMAIGIGRMIGFDFPENFNNPYISQNISEFWRRWHITLGKFMKDYLYIPLGGNRVAKSKMFFNLWVVFLISGLWHGAAWTFVIWGAFHGLFLVLDRLFLLRFYKKIGKIPSIILTFIITMVGWALFRAETLPFAWDYIGTMFSFNFTPSGIFFEQKFWTILVIAAFFSLWAAIPGIESWQNRLFSKNHSMRTVLIMVAFSVLFFIFSLAAITSSGFNPFIYFRF
ncbi:MAG: MBOAT family protein [Bacteroidia bacterium]|nr:MBOAT family protein [Bacteroidia bacterium]